MFSQKFYKSDNFFSVFLPIILVALNFLLKGIFITFNSIALDEPFSIYYAQMELTSIIQFLSTGNNPPLYELFLHYWINIFGISPFSVRLPSLIFSSLSILVIYRLAKKYFNTRVAIYASIFYLFSNTAILYAHEARVYSLFALLTITSMYFFFEIVNNKTLKPLRKVLFLIVQILLIYAHYFGFVVLAFQVLFFLFHKRLREKYWKNFVYGSLIIFIFYLPNIKVFVDRFLDSSINGTWLAKSTGIEDLYYMLVHFSNAPIVAVGILLVFVLAVIKYLKEKTAVSINTYLVALWFLSTYLILFILSFWMPVFIERYLMFLTSGFYLTVAIAVDYLDFKGRIKYMIPIALCALFLFTTDLKTSNKRDIKQTIAKIKELKTDNTIVYVSPDWFDLNFVYYYDKDLFQTVEQNTEYPKLLQQLNSENVYFINDQSKINLAHLQQNKKVLFLDAGSKSFFPNNGILKKLMDNNALKNEHHFFEIFTIYEFSKKE